MFAFDWRLFLTIHNPLVTMWPVLSFFLVAFFACLIINDFACTAWTHFFFAEWYSWYYLILSTICIQLMIIISPKNVIDLRSTIPVLCKNVGGMESATVSARKGLITFKFSHKDNLQNISCGDNGSLCIMLPQLFLGWQQIWPADHSSPSIRSLLWVLFTFYTQANKWPDILKDDHWLEDGSCGGSKSGLDRAAERSVPSRWILAPLWILAPVRMTPVYWRQCSFAISSPIYSMCPLRNSPQIIRRPL